MTKLNFTYKDEHAEVGVSGHCKAEGDFFRWELATKDFQQAAYQAQLDTLSELDDDCDVIVDHGEGLIPQDRYEFMSRDWAEELELPIITL